MLSYLNYIHVQADGEHKAIRRETEKNYVDKWEKSRVENFKFKFKSEELELQKYMIELQAKMKTDQVVDNENEQYLDYSIKVNQHTCTNVLYEYLKILN